MKKSENAFTLIEIVMILGTVAIFTIFAVPKITSYSTLKLMGAASKLASDIRYAQQLAISKQRHCGVFFDSNNYHRYFVYEWNKEKTNITKAVDPFTRRELTVDYLANNSYNGVHFVNIDFGDVLEFNPWGKPETSGTVILQYKFEPKTIAIVVSPGTGSVDIQ